MSYFDYLEDMSKDYLKYKTYHCSTYFVLWTSCTFWTGPHMVNITYTQFWHYHCTVGTKRFYIHTQTEPTHTYNMI